MNCNYHYIGLGLKELFHASRRIVALSGDRRCNDLLFKFIQVKRYTLQIAMLTLITPCLVKE